MAPRRRTNPLALTILSLLQEGPRHPYELAATLKLRHKHESIRLNYGSLYAVVEKLLTAGFIEVVDTEREGNRPERTVYGLTDAGLREMTDWLSDLLAEPKKEYLQFEAALSLIVSLPPADALALLDHRIEALGRDLARFEAQRAFAADELGLPRVFAIEHEYLQALLSAERDFVTALADEIRNGTLAGIGLWRRFYDPDAPTYDGEGPFDPDWQDLDADPVPTHPSPLPPTPPAQRRVVGAPSDEPIERR